MSLLPRPATALLPAFFTLLWAGVASAQTGPTKDAADVVDVGGTMNSMALVAIPLLALVVLALFEPWKWPGKIGEARRRKKKRDQK